MVGFFAENKKSDLMIGMDLVDADDVGGHKLEDEHDIISLVDIFLFILLNGSWYFFLLVCLFLHFFNVGHAHSFYYIIFCAFFPFDVEYISLDINFSLIKLLILLDVDPWSQAIDHFLFLPDQGVIIYFTPLDTLISVVC